MDKVEYKIRADEIKALIGEGRFAEAVKIADTIDWKRVKSISMLCTISDLYKINRRYTESKDVLLMAYDRHPTSRPIVYSLCELAIKMGEFVQAVEYYKEFVRIAPRDTGRYILQYKLYEAQEVSLEERIAVLEEFKKHDYRERWAYELAYLYHRVGLTTECIEECDEMFLWFGEGRYVMKALELKALHEPLSPEQQDRYARYRQSSDGVVDASIIAEKDEVGKDETRTVEIKQPTKEMPPITDEVIASYSRRKERREVPEEDNAETKEFNPNEISSILKEDEEKEDVTVRDQDEIVYPHISEIKEPSVDVSTYNTQNLQEQLAESLRQAFSDENDDTKVFEPVTDAAAAGGQLQPITEEIFEDTEDEVPVEETKKIGAVAVPVPEPETVPEPVMASEPETVQSISEAEKELEPEEEYYQQELMVSEQTLFDEEEPVASDMAAAETVDLTAVSDNLSAASGDLTALSEEAAVASDDLTAVSEEPVVASDDLTEISDVLSEENSYAADTGMQEIYLEKEPTMGIEIKYGGNGPILGEEKIIETPAEPAIMATAVETVQEEDEEESNPVIQPFKAVRYEEKPLEDEIPGAVIHPNANYQMHSQFDNLLSQEPDGQISLAVEPQPEVEKQITGQISIAEYLENWEQFKKDQQQKQLESVKKRVADETGDMFAEFDEKTRAGLQEKIEKAIAEAIKKDRRERYSGRGDWSVKREDRINAAIDEVIEQDEAERNRAENPEPEYEEPEFVDEIPAEEESSFDAPPVVIEKAEEPVRSEYDAEEEAAEEEPAQDNAEEDTASADTVDEEEAKEAESEEPQEEASQAQEPQTEESEESAKVQVEASDASEDARAEEESGKEESDKEEQDKEESGVEESDKENSGEEAAENKEQNPEKPKVAAATDAGKAKTAEPAEAKKRHHIGNRELEERVRSMTPEEKELFGPYIHHKKSRRQIINAIDNLSMDAYTGNAVVTGEEGAGTVNLAKGLIKAMQASDANFSGKVAKITANVLNKKSTASIFEKLANGALIIQRAADLDDDTVVELLKILQEENKGLVVVMEDTREDMDKFLERNPELKKSFNVRVDIEALDDDSLVAYARQYALEKEFAIDNLGILALHTRISERQTLDHDVTVAEVKDIIDDAIYFAEKRTVGHLVDVLVRKRYDENDMIILREKDFMHD